VLYHLSHTPGQTILNIEVRMDFIKKIWKKAKSEKRVGSKVGAGLAYLRNCFEASVSRQRRKRVKDVGRLCRIHLDLPLREGT
jgi:hypothetical protein